MPIDLPTYEHQLILGKQPQGGALGSYRRKLLIGELSILALIFNLAYLVTDLLSGGSIIIIIYVINIGLFTLAFFSNRSGHFETAKIVLLYSILLSVYLFGSNNLENTETYVLYFPLIVLAFTVNGYQGRYFSVAFAVVTLLLYMLDTFTGFSLFPTIYLEPFMVRLMSAMNFIFALIGIVYISYFLTRSHFLSEKDLVTRQTKLNQLTRDLHKSRQRYKLAMIGTNAGLWDWDLKHNKIYHGPKWKEMLGFGNDEFENASIENIYELIHPDDLPQIKQAIKDHLDKQVPFEMEYRMRKKDGTYEWFYDSGKAIYDPHSVPLRMVGSIININKRKLAEEKMMKQKELLERANAELDRFVYITSHDLKAPLLSIEGLINLAEISEDNAEIEMCLQMMKERIKGLQHFISDIMDYSRNVRTGLVNEEIPVKKMVESVYNDLFYMDNVDKIAFNMDIEDDLVFISDEKRLNVILKNLIYNAFKYHNIQQEHPSVTITARENENKLIISVKDNGEGIQTEIQDKIYDMFFRASEKSSGSGLGLYIVREMVNKLGGTIELTSSPGEGSDFRVHLPLKIATLQKNIQNEENSK